MSRKMKSNLWMNFKKLIHTEPIGSIPRPIELIDGIRARDPGQITDSELAALTDAAVRDPLQRFEETGSPVISDGEQRKAHNFADYWIGLGQRVYVGVIDVLDPRIETAEEVCDRVLEAADHIPLDQLGTTDDCGYSPFCDDLSTTGEMAFAKIKARVAGTALAAAAFARRS